jgi:hypothetical protein
VLPKYGRDGSARLRRHTGVAAQPLRFLKVRLDTVKSWCAGRNVAKPAVLAELRVLYANIQAAADKLVQDTRTAA